MNVFQAVKENLSTRQAAEFYGININRRGMAICPFHSDKNPSMKVDRRFHCFGCQADGDVIDFVSRLKGLSSLDAALTLAQDFSISYERGGNHDPPKVIPEVKRKNLEQMYQNAEKRCYQVYSDYLKILYDWKRTFTPKTLEEPWHPLFCEALEQITKVEYLLDILLFGDFTERMECVTAQGKEVTAIEQRVKEFKSFGTETSGRKVAGDGTGTDRGRNQRKTTIHTEGSSEKQSA